MTLGGKKYPLVVDLNTYTAFEKKFEERTGYADRHGGAEYTFLTFIYEIQLATASAQKGDEEASMFDVIRAISLTKVQCLLWAAIHGYEGEGNNVKAVWPLSYEALGRLVTPANMNETVIKAFTAAVESKGPAEETPEEQVEDPTVSQTESSTTPNGGWTSGPSDAAVLASLTPISEDSPTGDTESSPESTTKPKEPGISDSTSSELL